MSQTNANTIRRCEFPVSENKYFSGFVKLSSDFHTGPITITVIKLEDDSKTTIQPKLAHEFTLMMAKAYTCDAFNNAGQAVAKVEIRSADRHVFVCGTAFMDYGELELVLVRNGNSFAVTKVNGADVNHHAASSQAVHVVPAPL